MSGLGTLLALSVPEGEMSAPVALLALQVPNAAVIPRVVGGCYVFFRDGHPWHGKEVAVVAIDDAGFRCMLAHNLFAALLAPRGSRKRKVKLEVFSREELW